MNRFEIISRETMEGLIHKREGEVKLGETVGVLDTDVGWETSLEKSPARFVLLGIPEDIGIRANFGIGGAQTTWLPALKSILNIQNTHLLPGKELLLAGAFDFSDWMEQSRNFSVQQLRDMVSEIDQIVCDVLEIVFSAGKVPIIIGGGHNNAYPILKAASRAFKKPVNCINMDAHADFRVMEGRHSGNGFRYALEEGFLNKYAAFGLHQNYNSQAVLNEMEANPKVYFSFFEDIFLNQKIHWEAEMDSAFRFVAGLPTGIELDLDCIENTLSSASTPSGFTALEARRFLVSAAQTVEVAYLHLPEGCFQRADNKEDYLVPKLISYLVSDFMRGFLNRKTVFFQPAQI